MQSARCFLGDDFDSKKDVQIWAGVMGVSPDDLPVVGKTAKYSNLYLNTGHGFRGTNYSLTTAKLLADIMNGVEKTCIDQACGLPSRFGI